MNQEELFEELDEFCRESEVLYGAPIRSIYGDIQNLKSVQLREYWNDAGQIVRPVSNEKVQEYLKNKDDRPFVFPKIAVFTLAGLLLTFGVVHGISNRIRAAEKEASKNYANVITVDENESPVDEAEKTELVSGKTYLTEDKQFEIEYSAGMYYGEEGIIIMGYLGDDIEVTLPKEIQGYPIVRVERAVFEGNDAIEKVIIESEVTGIEFRDCAALREVTLPATVNEIGAWSFYNTPRLESLTVDKGCFVDNNLALDNTVIINYVEMTEGVGDNTQIEMEDEHNYYTADGQFQFQFEDNTIKLKRYIGNSTEAIVPKEIQGYPVTEISRSTFEENNEIKKVVIEAEITSGGDIFRDCEGLEEVVFPSTVERLGYSSLYNTPSLKSVTVSRNCEVDNEFVTNDITPEIKYYD